MSNYVKKEPTVFCFLEFIGKAEAAYRRGSGFVLHADRYYVMQTDMMSGLYSPEASDSPSINLY
jgi:hypothetical protein